MTASILRTITRFTGLLLLSGAAVSTAGAELVVHVSRTAADGGAGADGSAQKPFVSITAARDFIRAGRKDGKIPPTEAITVEIAAGVYPIEKLIAFTAADGGTAEAPVTYRAEKKGAAELRGGVTLPGDAFRRIDDAGTLSRLAESARGKVLVCDLGNYISAELPVFGNSFRGTPPGPWLYVDGESMTLARWPNKDADNHGWAVFSEVIDKGFADPGSNDPAMQKAHPGAFVFDDPRPASWDIDAGVWLLGYWTHDWYDENIRIDSYDAEKKVIRLAARHSYGLMGGTWGAKGRRFFAHNLLAELDAPGEWFVDRVEKKLFYYPASPIADSEVVLATSTESLLSFTDTKHLNLEGLSFGYSHGSGLSAKQVEHLAISGCTFHNLSGTGITLNGAHSRVQSCDIFNIGRNGISLSGGDRKTLTPAENLIANNHIHHYALFQRTYAPAISASGCGQTVRNNLIHHAPHNAIGYSGNEHLFELNEIHHVVMETGDSGAFYTGRDWTSQGNVLRHNFIHDLGGDTIGGSHTMGIYLDDCDSGDTLQGNVFHKAGRAIMIGGGRDNPVRNNLVIDSAVGLHLDARGMSWKQWNNPDEPSWMLEKKAEALSYKSPPWSEKYPSLAKIMSDSPREPLHNPITGNVFINTSEKVMSLSKDSTAILPKLKIEDNLMIQPADAEPKITAPIDKQPGFSVETEAPADLGFTDAANGDFSLKEGAWLLQKSPGLKEIPFDKIGLYRDPWRTDLP